MAVRFPQGCSTCPKPEPVLPTIVTVDPEAYNEQQAERLWRHVLVGTSTCVGMLEAYAEIGMPGNPSAGIGLLRDRLNKLLTQLDSTNVDRDSA